MFWGKMYNIGQVPFMYGMYNVREYTHASICERVEWKSNRFRADLFIIIIPHIFVHEENIHAHVP